LLAVAESHGIDLSGVTIHEANPSESGLSDLGDDLDSPDPDLPERDYTALHPEEIELGQSLRNIVARRIRCAIGDSIFLIALTGYGQPEDRERVREAGFDLHLVKPVHPDQLNAILSARLRPAK